MIRRAYGLLFIFRRPRWNDHPVFRRVVTGFASVTINARRRSWNAGLIKNARMEAAVV